MNRRTLVAKGFPLCPFIAGPQNMDPRPPRPKIPKHLSGGASELRKVSQVQGGVCPTSDLKCSLLTWACQWGRAHLAIESPSFLFYRYFPGQMTQQRVRRCHEDVRCFLYVISDQKIVASAYVFIYVCKRSTWR